MAKAVLVETSLELAVRQILEVQQACPFDQILLAAEVFLVQAELAVEAEPVQAI